MVVFIRKVAGSKNARHEKGQMGARTKGEISKFGLSGVGANYYYRLDGLNLSNLVL